MSIITEFISTLFDDENDEMLAFATLLYIARRRRWMSLHMLGEAERLDNLDERRRRHQARKLRSLRTIILRDADFTSNYGLSKDLFKLLREDISAYIPRNKRASGLSKELKILCTLSFMASGSYQNFVRNADYFVSQPSAFRALHDVINVLCHPDIVRKYIKFPQNKNDRLALKQSFYEKYKIPGVIGCIQGTFVAMIRPKEDEDLYDCGGGYYARKLILITDANLNILHLDVTCGGTVEDNFVYELSDIRFALEKLTSNGEIAYLLGDSKYAQTPNIMTPYTNPEPGSSEEYYNSLHSSALKSAEQTISALKSRFRCLLVRNVLRYDKTFVGKIAIACCVLHNMCNKAGIPAPTLSANTVAEEESLNQLLTGTLEPQDDLEEGLAQRQVLTRQLWCSQRQQ